MVELARSVADRVAELNGDAGLVADARRVALWAERVSVYAAGAAALLAELGAEGPEEVEERVSLVGCEGDVTGDAVLDASAVLDVP